MPLQPIIIHEDKVSLKADNNTEKLCYLVLGKNYLTYLLIDTKSTKIYVLRHYDAGNDVIGKNDFNAILGELKTNKIIHFHVAVDSLKSTLVPIEYYDGNHCDTLLKAMFTIDSEEIMEAQILKVEIVTLYALKKATVEFLKATLSQVTFYDANACLLEMYPSQIESKYQHSLFISCKEESVCISMYEKQKLLLHQITEITSSNDVLYFVSNAVNQLSIKNEALGIYLHGESKMLDNITKTLRQYYMNIRFVNRVNEFLYPESFNTKPSYSFFTLFSFVKCVS
jgi:hypothetical protein